jgi:drug/metabolite transporter (DMT)-like permease
LNIKGTLYFFLFILLVSLSGVYQAHLSQHISPLVFIFFYSTCTFLFFFPICLFQGGIPFLSKLLPQKKNILFLNIANIMVWGCYTYSLKYLEPAIAVIIGNASGPILVIFVSKWLRPHVPIYRPELISAIGISFALIFIVYTNLLGESALINSQPKEILIGLSLCFITGLGQVLTSIYAKKLNEVNFTPNEVLSIRFPLLFLLSILFINKNILAPVFSFSVFFTIIGITFLGIIIPLYFYQKSVKLIEPIYISILYIIEPVLMFIAQLFDPRLKISLVSYASVAMICLFSAISIYGRYYGMKISKSNSNKILS